MRNVADMCAAWHLGFAAHVMAMGSSLCAAEPANAACWCRCKTSSFMLRLIGREHFALYRAVEFPDAGPKSSQKLLPAMISFELTSLSSTSLHADDVC